MTRDKQFWTYQSYSVFMNCLLPISFEEKLIVWIIFFVICTLYYTLGFENLFKDYKKEITQDDGRCFFILHKIFNIDKKPYIFQIGLFILYYFFVLLYYL